MLPLALPYDVEVRLGRSFTDGENGRISFVLDDVSSIVRQYTGRTFTASTRTERRQPMRGVVILNERPVTSITSVKDTAGNDVSYLWDGLNRVFVPAFGTINQFEVNLNLAWWTGPTVVDVVYVAGPAAVPDPIVAVVCQMAMRTLGRAPEDAGISQESITNYSYSIGAAGAAGAAGMLADERAVLDRYRRVGGTIMVDY